MMRLLWLLVTVAARELPLAPLRPWNQSKLLQHLHVQKCGGTSIDAFFAERRVVDRYRGHKHFDASCIDPDDGVIFMARDPTARAISHFHFVKMHAWTASYPAIRGAPSLTALAAAGRGNLFWRDGEGLASWLSGTYVKASYHCDGAAERFVGAAVAERALALMRRATWFGVLERPRDNDVLFRRVFGVPLDMPRKNDNRRYDAGGEDTAFLGELHAWDRWLYACANAILDARLAGRSAFAVPDAPSAAARNRSEAALRASVGARRAHEAEDRAALAAAAGRGDAAPPSPPRRKKKRRANRLGGLRWALGAAPRALHAVT